MFLAVENARLRREDSFLSFVEMRECKTCTEIFKPDDCCREKSRGFSFFQPQSEDLCWDLDVFHPNLFWCKRYLGISEHGFHPGGSSWSFRYPDNWKYLCTLKKLDALDLIDISNDIFKEARDSIKLLPAIRHWISIEKTLGNWTILHRNWKGYSKHNLASVGRWIHDI